MHWQHHALKGVEGAQCGWLPQVSEVGELAEVFQWKGDAAAARGLPGFTAGERVAVQTELSDVLLYLVRLADVCGIDLAAAAIAKLEEVTARGYPCKLA